MKKLLSLALFAHLSILAFSQRPFFVYLESAQPFFVKLDDRTYSSGNSGYIILPQLADSTYLLRVGFPQNRYPDQLFRMPMNGRDHGYVLTDGGTDTWKLDETQDAQSIRAEKTNGTFRAEPRTVGRFTDILAKATDDPSLRFTMVRIQPAPDAQKDPVLKDVTTTGTVQSVPLPLSSSQVKKEAKQETRSQPAKPDTVLLKEQRDSSGVQVQTGASVSKGLTDSARQVQAESVASNKAPDSARQQQQTEPVRSETQPDSTRQLQQTEPVGSVPRPDSIRKQAQAEWNTST
ncbi:MAG: hypothetical protein EOO05_19920, partial [Chitinophagaceae bacterium]